MRSVLEIKIDKETGETITSIDNRLSEEEAKKTIKICGEIISSLCYDILPKSNKYKKGTKDLKEVGIKV